MTLEPDMLSELAAAWLRCNLRAPKPAPTHTRLTCVVPDCNGMSFVILPSDKEPGHVCFRHYQTIARAAGRRNPD